MRMYTELHFNVELPQKTMDEGVINALQYMVNPDHDSSLDPLPDHPFFKTPRWLMLFHCDSYYFAMDAHSNLRFDEIGDCWRLGIRSNLKNYGDEIKLFLDWIMPYVESHGEVLGYWRYEESLEPTLIYKESGD